MRIRAARAVGPLPIYGDAAWQALPARDPRRWGACLVAAEAWRDFRSAERVALDLEIEERAFVTRISTASVDVSLATNWTAAAAMPSYAELFARRSAA